MKARIMCLDDEGFDGGIEIGERQARRYDGLPVRENTRQARQKFSVDGAEETFDLLAPLGTPDCREHQFDM